MPTAIMPEGRQRYYNNDGTPCVGGKLYTYAAGTTNPKATYSDEAGTVPNANPIVLDAKGEAVIFWTGAYKVDLKQADATQVTGYPVDNLKTDPAGMWAMFATLAASAGASLLGFLHSVTGAISRTMQAKARDLLDARDIGATTDGVDSTPAILAFFTNNAAFRGVLRLPYGCKFNRDSVFAALPVGCVLWDESSINTGQPPGYKNKGVLIVTNDHVDDDAQHGVVSSHHPSYRLNNTGTSGTDSAKARFVSFIRAAGFRWNDDPIDGMQWLTYQSPRGKLWRTADVLGTPFEFATDGAKQWTAGENVAAGSLRNTSAGNVYKTTAGGVCGGAVPVGTGAGISDGAVVWDYAGVWSAGHTVFYYDEDGFGGLVGVNTGRLGVESATRKGLSINVDEASGDTFLRDDQRNQDLLRRSVDSGIQLGGVPSLAYGGPIGGATPSVTSEYHSLSNAVPTNITDFHLPAGQIRGWFRFIASDGNATLKWAGSNFSYLQGLADVTVPQNGVMEFSLDPAISAGWVEHFRNFV